MGQSRMQKINGSICSRTTASNIRKIRHAIRLTLVEFYESGQPEGGALDLHLGATSLQTRTGFFRGNFNKRMG